ncbi:MAG: iron-containing alcohol dehydrogenase [Nitrososphaeria archaeon]|nr:iron-containing alcohol dehydrogenase [Nitrososphaeria archaeon]
MNTVYPSIMKFSFQTPKWMLFGSGAAENVGLEAKQFNVKKGLILTDENIEKTGLVDKVRKSLEVEGLEINIFNKVEPEPRLEMAESTANAARESKYEFVVGIGGGSVLDMAKLASIAITNPGDISRYVGGAKIQKPGVPKILLPTTAGTGSEVSRYAVVSLSAEELKTSVVDPKLLADVAIVDPTATVTMPPKTTAGSGMDALSHAVEAMMSLESSPLTDAVALEAIERIAKNLRAAYFQRENLEARYNMSLAAMMAGLALENAGTCGGHAASNAYGTKYRIPHGVACGIALPYLMEYNLPKCEQKLASIASAMGEKTDKLSRRETAYQAVVAVQRLIKDIDVPSNLKGLGIPREAIPRIAEKMLKGHRMLVRQPRKLTKDDAIKLMDKMYGE